MNQIKQSIKSSNHSGFTLIELMIVIAIIGVLSAIAYPNYQNSVVKTKRTDMMSDISDIASNIEAAKLAKGKYASVDVTPYEGDYPQGGDALYTVTITPSPLAANWIVTATPKSSGRMDGDGILTHDYQGKKCRNTTCGYGKEWNE